MKFGQISAASFITIIILFLFLCGLGQYINMPIGVTAMVLGIGSLAFVLWRKRDRSW